MIDDLAQLNIHALTMTAQLGARFDVSDDERWSSCCNTTM